MNSGGAPHVVIAFGAGAIAAIWSPPRPISPTVVPRLEPLHLVINTSCDCGVTGRRSSNSTVALVEGVDPEIIIQSVPSLPLQLVGSRLFDFLLGVISCVLSWAAWRVRASLRWLGLTLLGLLKTGNGNHIGSGPSYRGEICCGDGVMERAARLRIAQKRGTSFADPRIGHD